MQSLLKDAQEYLQILHNCRTQQVVHWKENDLKRAVDWALHFEKVYVKLGKSKKEVYEKFNSKLVSLSHQATFQLGYDEFNIEFLGHSLEYLVKSLLENPSLPPELKETLSKDDVVLKYVDVTQHETVLDEKYKLLKVLMNIQSSCLNADSKLHMPSGEVLVNAVAVMEEFKIVVDKRSPDLKNMSLLMERISTISLENGGMEAILTCLANISLKEKLKGSNSSYETFVKQVILKWLEKNHFSMTCPAETSSGILSVSPELLAWVSKGSVEFYQMYMKLLLTFTEDFGLLRMVSQETRANATSLCEILKSNSSLSYENILLLWKALCCHDDTLRDKCLAVLSGRTSNFKLVSLDTSKRTSVWNDLLQDIP